jgi:AraC family transcriptional regulator
VRRDTQDNHRALIESAVRIIERELENDLGLDHLARRLGVSPFHFHRLFTANVGEPPAAHVRRLRLERAALRLKYSRLSVTEIAFAAGYETHESFTRAFKSRFDLPPRQFRAQARHAFETIDIEPRIVQVPARRIAVVRHVGPYEEIAAPFEKVVSWAGRRGLLAGAKLLGVYWDDQRITPPHRTRCEVGLYVDDYAVGDDEVSVRHLPAGEYAVYSYHGSSEGRRRSYDLVYGHWLPERRREAANEPPIEVYTTYGGALDGVDRVTSVHVPLVPRRAA